MTAPRRPPTEAELRQGEAATWGHKPAVTPSEGLGRAEQIAEINREIAVRKRIYPTWVKDGRIPQERADRQIALLEAAVVSLGEPAGGQDTPSGSRNVPPVIATNWRAIGKGTLIGTADAIIGRWVVKECAYHRQGDKRWVHWPAREWTDRAGEKKYTAVIGFTDPDLSRQLRVAVLEAIRVLIGEQAAGSGSGRQPDQPSLNFGGPP